MESNVSTLKIILEVDKVMLEVMSEFVTNQCAPHKASFRNSDVHVSPIARLQVGVKNIEPVVSSCIY